MPDLPGGIRRTVQYLAICYDTGGTSRGHLRIYHRDHVRESPFKRFRGQGRRLLTGQYASIGGAFDARQFTAPNVEADDRRRFTRGQRVLQRRLHEMNLRQFSPVGGEWSLPARQIAAENQPVASSKGLIGSRSQANRSKFCTGSGRLKRIDQPQGSNRRV